MSFYSHVEAGQNRQPVALALARLVWPSSLLTCRGTAGRRHRSVDSLVDLILADAVALCPEAGIVKKWADKYGIQIHLVAGQRLRRIGEPYTAGALDGVVSDHDGRLTIPSAGGGDTTAMILGDYSNGNDACGLNAPTLPTIRSHRHQEAVRLIWWNCRCRNICWPGRWTQCI